MMFDSPFEAKMTTQERVGFGLEFLDNEKNPNYKLITDDIIDNFKKLRRPMHLVVFTQPS